LTTGLGPRTAEPIRRCAGRDPGRLRLQLAHDGGLFGQLLERIAGIPAKWGDPHHPTQAEPVGIQDPLCQSRDLPDRGARPTARLRRVEADLDEAVDLLFALLRTAAQPADQLGPVDGVHRVGIAGHGRCLVALQCTYEVPGQAEVSTLGRLLHRFLVPVLPHVAYAEVGEQPDV
jgi:hypothetical protein